MNKDSITKLIRFVITFATGFGGRNPGNYAASTAFFFFISLIPIFILISVLLPVTGVSEDTFIRVVTHYTPDIIDGIVASIIVDAFNSSTKVVSISAVTLVYTAGRGMMALMQGLNVVYDIREHRNYIHIIFVAILYMFFFLLFTIAFFILMVFGEIIFDFVRTRFPDLDNIMEEIMAMRSMVLLATAIVLFNMLYSFVPALHQKFLHQIPGAVFSTVGWYVFSKFFSIFMSNGSIYTTYYGNLAAIVIFLMWMYGVFYIVLFGGYLNHVFMGFLHEFSRQSKE